MDKRKQYCRVLGLSDTPTEAELKKAYRTLSKRYHPDLNEKTAVGTNFMLINEAYNYLLPRLNEPITPIEPAEIEITAPTIDSPLEKSKFPRKLFIGIFIAIIVAVLALLINYKKFPQSRSPANAITDIFKTPVNSGCEVPGKKGFFLANFTPANLGLANTLCVRPADSTSTEIIADLKLMEPDSPCWPGYVEAAKIDNTTNSQALCALREPIERATQFVTGLYNPKLGACTSGDAVVGIWSGQLMCERHTGGTTPLRNPCKRRAYLWEDESAKVANPLDAPSWCGTDHE